MNVQIEKRGSSKAAFVIGNSYKRRIGLWPSTVSDEEIMRQVQMKEAKVGLA